jgi:hypothetical protein
MRDRGGLTMITALNWNEALIDERSERPMLIGFVVTVAVWAIAFAFALA